MRRITLPDVAYGATAVRPNWLDLPTHLRDAIAQRLGAPVTAATSAAGGFTRTFAAVLTTAAGERVFLKAAAAQAPETLWYAREYAITQALPAAVSAARPRWSLATEGWYAVCFDAVAGHVPRLPWSAPDLEAALTAWRTAAAALATPPPIPLTTPGPSDTPAGGLLELPALPDLIRDHLSWWGPIAAGQVPMPWHAPEWTPHHLPELVALERALPALATGPAMLHGDLRIDNVMIDDAGRAWLCDWTWPCVGAPWFDTVTLLVSAYASGLDVDALLAEGPDAPPAEGIDGTLAAMGGYWLVQASGPPSSASPHSAQHHRFSGTQAMAWLAERRGWSTPTDENRPE